MSALSRQNKETYGIPAISQIIHAKVSEGGWAPESSFMPSREVIWSCNSNCNLEKSGAFKESSQKKNILIIKSHSVTSRLQYKTLL